MEQRNNLSFEEITWDDCRADFQRLVPDVFQAIEKMNPGKKHRLFRARYPFGATIIEQGRFRIPWQGKLVNANSPDIPQEIQQAIGHQLPMTLLTAGQVDLYAKHHDGSIETPKVYRPGTILALRGLLDPPKSYQTRNTWYMSSGSRSPLFIPSISNNTAFNRLKKHFTLRTQKPINQHDHYPLMVELANHKDFPNPWYSEHIFFSKPWLEKRDDDAWRLFYLSLLEIAWRVSSYDRNNIPINRLWNNFVAGIRHKYVNEYILTTVKHIIEASLGQAPSYCIADNDNIAGPFSDLNKIILDIYQLKRFTPIIMASHIFDHSKQAEGYLSLKKLSVNWRGKVNFENMSLLQHARLMSQVLQQFSDLLSRGTLHVEDSPFDELRHLDHDFFFSSPDPEKELALSAHLFDDNPVVQQLAKQTGNVEIPTSKKNLFLSCCVRIRKKSSQ
jgi:hypothetical protein